MPLVYFIKKTREHFATGRESPSTLVLTKDAAYRFFKSAKSVRAFAVYKGSIEQRAELIVAEAVKVHRGTHEVPLCLSP